MRRLLPVGGPSEELWFLQQLLEALNVLVVLRADVFPKPGAFTEHQGCAGREWLRKDLRILDSGFVLDGVVVDSRVALGDVQSFGMKDSARKNPSLVIESDDVDNERVAFPVSDRMSQE